MPKYVLVVRGKNMLAPPILVTGEAAAVEIYDASGELVAVLHRVLEGQYWAVTTAKDPDWEQCLGQLGYLGTRSDLVPARRKEFFDV